MNVPFFVNECQDHIELSATAFRQLGIERLPGVLMDIGCLTPLHLASPGRTCCHTGIMRMPMSTSATHGSTECTLR